MESGLSLRGLFAHLTLLGMQRVLAATLCLGLTACGPPYAWGDAERVEERLVRMVPLGSSPSELAAAAKERGWKIDRRNMWSQPAGSKTYFDDHGRKCRSRGGPVVPAIIAHYYSPLETYESLWLFDTQLRLRDVCVRKTMDGI